MSSSSVNNGIPSDRELDVRMLACPMPLLKTRQQLRHMQDGEVLLVRATDPGSARDIPAYLGQVAHELVHRIDGDDEYCFWIRVRHASTLD